MDIYIYICISIYSYLFIHLFIYHTHLYTYPFIIVGFISETMKTSGAPKTLAIHRYTMLYP